MAATSRHSSIGETNPAGDVASLKTATPAAHSAASAETPAGHPASHSTGGAPSPGGPSPGGPSVAGAHGGGPSGAAPTGGARFIPVSTCDLARALQRDAAEFGMSREEMAAVLHAAEEAIAAEIRPLERSTADEYAAFNPDRDTVPLCVLPRDQLDHQYASLEERVVYLFDKANFERLDDVEIAAAIREAKSHGLRIRIRAERVERLLMWVRGHGFIYKRVPHWSAPFRGRNVRFAVFQRLGVLARLKDDPHVHLRLFRDVPVADVESLLPHAEVGMSWLDRGKVIAGGAGALATLVIKLLQGALTLALLSKLVWVAAMAFGMMAGRTFLGYRRNKSLRDAQRTRHLYYQTLANNGGVLSWLVDMIGQEEEKEAILGYAASKLQTPDEPPTPVRPAMLAERAQSYLHAHFGVAVRFDAADAIETMERFGLLQRDAPGAVVDPQTAVDRLRAAAQTDTARSYHARMMAAHAETNRPTDPAAPLPPSPPASSPVSPPVSSLVSPVPFSSPPPPAIPS